MSKIRGTYTMPMTLDYETNNLSFIQLAMNLKHLGVKNHAFALTLYDPGLIGVNPHDPNLSMEMRYRVMAECSKNPWYYLRECVRLSTEGGGTMFYPINRHTAASVILSTINIDHMITSPRQTYRTLGSLALLSWFYLFGSVNTPLSMMGKSRPDTDINFDRLFRLFDNLPRYMRPMTSGYRENGYVNYTTNNTLAAPPITKSYKKADAVGRGMQAVIQYYQDFEFSPTMLTTLHANGPMFYNECKKLEETGGRHFRLIESFIGGEDVNPNYSQILGFINQMVKWDDSFYDMRIGDLEKYIEHNSNNGFVHIEFSYKQLGFDEEWYKDQCRTMNNDPKKIKRELLLERD